MAFLFNMNYQEAQAHRWQVSGSICRTFAGMKYRKPLVLVALLFLVLIAVYFAFRNTVLTKAFSKAQKQAMERYGLELSAGSIAFSGIDKVQLGHVVVKPADADTLLQITDVKVNISLWDLLKGKVGFDGIVVNGLTATIYNDSTQSNIKGLTQRKSIDTNKVEDKADASYYDMAKSLQGKAFRILNTAFEVTDAHVLYTDSAYSEEVSIPYFRYDLKMLSGLVISTTTNDTLVCSGEVVKRKKKYKISLQQKGNGYLPFLSKKGSLQSRFNSLEGMVSLDDDGDALTVSVEGDAVDFRLNHWRIAQGDVVFALSGFKGSFTIGDELIQMDSTSEVKLGNVPFNVFAAYSHKPNKVFTLKANMPETPSDTFFNSLPDGMFQTLKGISCTGTLAYNLDFSIDTDNPDSLVFNSELKRNDFRINHFGAENYGKINGSFEYEAYDKDQLVRRFIVGENNPSFTPLNQINPYLPSAVMQSEDPSFMLHRGFLPEAFRESIVQNFKERRFARGGSTISMQLVKNVFLNRNKTISRKVEEALIVYLIETQRLASKDRMLEVYLNIIEWGPNVYGIGEASRFYFNKRPSQLSLQESIFLAGIIPRPKYFKYQFDKEGNMKPYLNGYFGILSRRMVRKGWIPESDTIGLRPDVKLTGPARNMVVPNAEIEPDFGAMPSEE